MANGSSQLRIIIDALWKGKGNLQQVRQDLKGVDDAAKKGSAGVDKFSESSETAAAQTTGFDVTLGDVANTMKAVGAGAVAAGATFKQAFDFGRAGAELNQLEGSFERINRDIFEMPALLEDMRTATRGTVRDADLMSGALTLTAGTTGEMTRALAASTPQILEMAKAASTINPMLGDTTFLFESLSIAAKRQSRLLADNAGIMISMENAVQKVHPALQSLADTYEELPENVRFLNEMLFQGANLIEMAGGAAESSVDSWEQLAVNVSGVRDELAQLFAAEIGPSVAAISGQHSDAVEGIIESNREAATSYDELLDVIQRTDETIGTGFMAKFAGALDGLQEGQRESIEQAALMADSYGQFESDMVRIFGSVEGAWTDLRAALGEEERIRLRGIGVESLEDWFRFQQNMEMARGEAALFRQGIEATNAALAGTGDAAGDATRGVSGFTERLEELGGMTAAEELLLLDLGDATRVYNDLTEEAVEKTDSYWQALDDASGRLRAAEEAQRDVNRAFGSGFVQALDDGEIANMDWRQALLESLSAAGAVPGVLAEAAEATGNYSEAQIQAAIKARAMAIAIDENAEQVAAGNITYGEAIDNLETLSDRLDDDYTLALDHSSVDEAERRTDSVIEKMQRLDGMEANMTAILSVQQNMAIPDAFMSGGTIGGIPEFHSGTGGRWMRVPGGQDPYPIHLAPNERFNVMTEAQWRSAQGGNGGGRHVNIEGGIQIIMPNAPNNPAAFAKQAAGLIANELNNNMRGG